MTGSQYAPLVRNLLRYLMLAVAGYSPKIAAAIGFVIDDPVILQAVTGLIVMGVTEAWYAFAKRTGRPT